MNSHRFAATVTTVVALFAVSACGSSPGSAATTTPSASSSPSSSPTSSPTSSPSSSPSSRSSSSDTVPACTATDLQAALSTGDGAMGTTYFTLSLRNTSDHPCRTGGYGGVSLVRGSHGEQLGAAAQRDPEVAVTPIVLIPGAHATARLGVTVAQNYPASACHPEPADGLRVYPPNETHSLFVARTGLTGCARQSVHLLRLSPYQPVH